MHLPTACCFRDEILHVAPNAKYKTKLYIVSLTLGIIKLIKMPDKNDFSEIIAELLLRADQTNDLLRQVVERQDRAEQIFNRGFTAMLKKLKSIDNSL
jgi:hypothetical protein